MQFQCDDIWRRVDQLNFRFGDELTSRPRRRDDQGDELTCNHRKPTLNRSGRWGLVWVESRFTLASKSIDENHADLSANETSTRMRVYEQQSTWIRVNDASLGFEWKYDIHSHPSKHDQRMAFLDSFIHLVPNRVFLHCFWLVHRRDCVFLHLLTSGMCQICLVIIQVADSCMAACCSWVVDDLYDLLSVI